MALLLTHLAHYCTGLYESELREALEVLLRMGESAQRDFYEGWLALARSAGRVDPGGWPAAGERADSPNKHTSNES